MKYTFLNTLLVLILAGCNDAGRTGTNSTPVATDTAAARRDNSEVNVRDRSDAVKTPIDQNENQRDIDITANIRKRVVDTRMSVNAQNAKIITQDGKVTLRGPVASVDEKNQIEKLAKEVAGPENVVSQLEVQP
jgi:hyperosmotically inducible protein